MSISWHRATILCITIASIGAVPLAGSIDGFPSPDSSQTFKYFAILWSGFFVLLTLSGLAFVLRLNMDEISLNFFEYCRRRRVALHETDKSS